ncbi:MAG: DNA polymerase III subunit epsilon [Hyphomicrobiaceae bacterium]
MQREIVMDTETTGLDANNGDRLIELGCVEIINRIPTGSEYHAFIHPEDRQVHPEAEAIHGISNDFLNDKPLFKDVVGDFMEFIGEAPLVIHNASFDIGFINMELDRLKRPRIQMDRVVDTLMLARKKHPAGPNSLDGLCKRYGIDNSKRDKHGAIIDSLLLADVYVELLGERQAALGLMSSGQNSARGERRSGARKMAEQRAKPLPARLSEEDVERHAEFVDSLGDSAIWKQRVRDLRSIS